MPTGTPSGSTSGMGAALTIMNTGSSRNSAVVLTELKTACNPGGRPEHYLRGRKRPNGPSTKGLLHLELMFKERAIVALLLDQAVYYARELSGDRRVGLTTQVSIQRITANIIVKLPPKSCSHAFSRRSARPSTKRYAVWRCHTLRCGSDRGICPIAEWQDSRRRTSGTGDGA